MHAGDIMANKTSGVFRGNRHTRMNSVSKEKVTSTHTSPRNANLLKRTAIEEIGNGSDGSFEKNAVTEVNNKKLKRSVRGQASLQDRGPRNGRPREAANVRPREADGRARGASNGRPAEQLEEAKMLSTQFEFVRFTYGNIWIPDLGKCATNCCKAGNFEPLLVKFAQEVSPNTVAHEEVRELEQCEKNKNLICILAEKKFSYLIILLVNNGFPVNYELDEKFKTLLIIASQCGNVFLIKFLLDKGANVNKFDVHIMTPLHYAVKNKHFNVVKMLVECGANINAKADSGYTPLHFACKNECSEVIEYLLEHGADVFIKNNVGKSAVLYCKSVSDINLLSKYSEQKYKV